MAHHNTIFAQILKLVSRHEFESLANRHHHGQKLRQMSRWSQFVALSMAQLSGRSSLRDIVSNLSAQFNKIYHLGCRLVTRSSLARVNKNQPYTLYEALFAKLLHRCQALAPRHKFSFKNKLYSLDATVIDLCLSVFPWAKFRSSKGAIKLHLGLDHDGYLPTFITITKCKTHEIQQARSLQLPKGSIVVFDRGYTDYAWYNSLKEQGIYFVTRLKRNASYTILNNYTVTQDQGINSDQTIKLIGLNAKSCPHLLRRIVYTDKQTGKDYVFLTNAFRLGAKTIADIYKERWQIELFFKWIKQNLKIKSFLGTSRNAVLSQIWVAMCMYLILAYMKFACKLTRSLQQILRLLQLNLFQRRDLINMLKPPPLELNHSQDTAQLSLI